MKIKFGAIVVDGRGKIGGHVMSKNRAGSYMRTKVTPSNPQTSYQSGVRNVFATLSAAWRSLTALAIAAWNSAVGDYKNTNIFGDVKHPSGFNLYQKLNNNLSQIGIAAIPLPLTPVAVPIITTGVLTAVHAGTIEVSFTTDPLVVASKIIISATTAQSIGKSFVKSEFRQIGILPAIVAHVSDFTTLYAAKFGSVPAAGKRIFVKLEQVVIATGQKGVPVVYSAVIS